MSDGTVPADCQAALKDHYQQLHDAITHARETCTDDGARRRLRREAQAVQAVLTAMDQADIASRTGEFDALVQQLKTVNCALSQLKDEIAGIVQNVAMAAKVVGTIDSALTASAKLLK